MNKNNVLTRFNAPQVICIGEALMDRLGPLGGNPLHDQPFYDHLGGAPANVACGLAKLGTSVAFLGRLGKDSIGKSFQDLFNLRGINLNGLQIDKDRPSRIVLVRRDSSGERSFQGFVGDQGKGFADQALSSNTCQAFWNKMSGKPQSILIGTIPLATKDSQETLLWCVNKAIEDDIYIVLDINWRSTFWDVNNSPESGPRQNELLKIEPLIQQASLLKLAKEEANWFFDCEDPKWISSSLSRHPDVVITDGSNPLRWFVGGFSGQIDAISPNLVVDTTGAGDAFTAGLINQLLRCSFKPRAYEDAADAIYFGAACGALVCTGAGGIDPQPTYADVLACLSGKTGGEI